MFFANVRIARVQQCELQNKRTPCVAAYERGTSVSVPAQLYVLGSMRFVLNICFTFVSILCVCVVELAPGHLTKRCLRMIIVILLLPKAKPKRRRLRHFDERKKKHLSIASHRLIVSCARCTRACTLCFS